jgi:peptide/nickel transport system permease protein
VSRLLLRRLAAAIVVAWGVATLAFLLVQAVPGRAFDELSLQGLPPHAAERLRVLFGADRPMAVRYIDWILGLLRGDLGFSLQLRRPVGGLVAEALGNTLALTGLALLVQVVVGIAVGCATAMSRSRWLDRASSGAAALVYSFPSFWMGLLLVAAFSIALPWLPVSQMRSIDAEAAGPLARIGDALRHLVLPCTALALPMASGMSLYVRDEMRAALARPFVAAARARGAGRARVAMTHALRSVLLPVVQIVGLSIQGVVAGSVVVEVLFAWPGMGRLAYDALLARDEPLVLACTLVGALAVVLGGLLADFASALLDPRFAAEHR